MSQRLNQNMEHESCCMTHVVGNFRVLQKCMQLSLTHQLDFVATSCLLYGNYENEFIELELKAGERTARKRRTRLNRTFVKEIILESIKLDYHLSHCIPSYICNPIIITLSSFK